MICNEKQNQVGGQLSLKLKWIEIVALTNKVVEWCSWDACLLFHVIYIKGMVHMPY